MSDPDELVTIARAAGSTGEVVLRRRTSAGGPSHELAVDELVVDELVVDGAFAMDSTEVSTEQALARVAVRPDGSGPGRVLVGGLGLGFTTLELLRAGAARVDVIELEACLVEWARAGLTASLAAVAADARVRLYVGDVADVLLGRVPDDDPESSPGADTRWDAILLDVDNGPDFLIHHGNARLYEPTLLGAATARLAPGGILAIWCQGPARTLAGHLEQLGGEVAEHLIPVRRGTRDLTYAIYTLTR